MHLKKYFSKIEEDRKYHIFTIKKNNFICAKSRPRHFYR